MSDGKVNTSNPVALGALVRGDIDNAIVASTPGGIEAQEAAGQRDMCEKAILPKDGTSGDDRALVDEERSQQKC